MLFPGSNITKKDNAKSIRSFTAENNMSVEAELKLLIFLKKTYPTSKLPLRQIKPNAFVSDMDSYLADENLKHGILEFDICPNKGCTVFVGDASYQQKCYVCNSPRYSQCKECTRSKTFMWELNNVDSDCSHPGRVPLKRITYRSILELFVSLVVYPTFIELINFKYVSYNNGNNQSDKPFICDIGDSIAYKEGMEEMVTSFRNHIVKKSIIDGVLIDESVIHVPLLLSIFYDGVQLFKTKQYPFHPLFLTILNLPPCFRNIVGIGN
jgi:hypothetical protein